MAYNEERHLAFEREERRRKGFARSAGYQAASMADPLIPYVCPTCACSVALSAVERHSAWHESAAA
jgi:hypothetical protein